MQKVAAYYSKRQFDAVVIIYQTIWSQLDKDLKCLINISSLVKRNCAVLSPTLHELDYTALCLSRKVRLRRLFKLFLRNSQKYATTFSFPAPWTGCIVIVQRSSLWINRRIVAKHFHKFSASLSKKSQKRGVGCNTKKTNSPGNTL